MVEVFVGLPVLQLPHSSLSLAIACAGDISSDRSISVNTLLRVKRTFFVLQASLESESTRALPISSVSIFCKSNLHSFLHVIFSDELIFRKGRGTEKIFNSVNEISKPGSTLSQ